jgi:predicted nucleic acid-binding protein
MNRDEMAGISRAFVDANALIYYIEGIDSLYEKVNVLFQTLLGAGVQLVINEIVFAECLYGAYRRKDDALAALYKDMLNDTDQFEILGIDMAMLDEAARTGARVGLKLIDAAHLYSAIASGCDLLVTNDQKFKSSPGLKIIQIGSL